MYTPKKILIIEDDISLSNALRDNLEYEGFQIFHAEDGEKGLSVALGERPDLILLDLVLPKKDGLELLRELRLDPWGKGVKIIILTNRSETEKVAKAMLHETFNYLVKSDVDIKAVIQMVKKNLGLSR